MVTVVAALQELGYEIQVILFYYILFSTLRKYQYLILGRNLAGENINSIAL